MSKSMEALNTLESMVMLQPAWLRHDEPWFRHWDKIPVGVKKLFSQLMSDDVRKLRTDYVRQWLFDASRTKSAAEVLGVSDVPLPKG